MIHGELSSCLLATLVYHFPPQLVGTWLFCGVLIVLIGYHEFMILMFFVFAIFLRSTLSISFRSGWPPCFFCKKHHKTPHSKDFLQLLFINYIFILKLLRHFKINLKFYPMQPLVLFAFFSHPIINFQLLIQFYYILYQLNQFFLRIIFPSFYTPLFRLTSNFPSFLLFTHVRINRITELLNFSRCISHKPV